MEQLYEKYLNIQLFATKYRNYELLKDKFDSYDDFKNKMQTFEYVLHTFNDPKNKGPNNTIHLYMFKHDSKFISLTTQFKKILDRHSTDKTTIIMITKEELNIYRKKSIKLYTNLKIKNYLHRHFIMEMNQGPLCSKHTILTQLETRAVCFDIMAHAHKFPAIFESDVQVIWIGGEVNDLIKIEAISEITGLSIHYRIVTPASGKVVQSTRAEKNMPAKALAVAKAEEGEEDEEDLEEVEVIEELEADEDNPGEDYTDDYVDNADEAE